MALNVDTKQLLEAGVHFGHKTSRWHPKMAPYIHSKRGDIHIIDLVQTAEQIEAAYNFVAKTVSSGKQVLFVGTKRQARDVISGAAKSVGQPYVTERWLGGMLTNSKTMNGRIKHLKSLEDKMASGELNAKYSKLEVQRFQEEIDRLNTLFGGIKDMRGAPGAVLVSDVQVDNIAVLEARRLNIPVIGVCDTNADPSNIDYPIAANDDAIKSITLITDFITKAVSEGKTKAPAQKPKDEDAKPAAKKPVKKQADNQTKADPKSDKKDENKGGKK